MIYLIHFDRKIAHAGHYIGFTEKESIEARIDRHARGNGSKLMRAVSRAGIGYRVVRQWAGDRHLERKMKNWHKASLLCPVCSPFTFHRRFKNETA